MKSRRLGWYVAEQDYEVGIPVIIVSDIKESHEFDCDGIFMAIRKKTKTSRFHWY